MSFGDKIAPRTITILMAAVCIITIMSLGIACFAVIQNAKQPSTDELLAQGEKFFGQNVLARFDDCQAGEDIRAALRAQAEEGRRTTAALLDVVPSLNTPEVKAIIRDSERRTADAFDERDCVTYALRAVPAAERDNYLHLLPDP